jgi:hypothetical protein
VKITYDSVAEFVRKNGNVKVIDNDGNTRILKNGQPDSFELLENANLFEYEGRQYGRAAFEKLLDSST